MFPSVRATEIAGLRAELAASRARAIAAADESRRRIQRDLHDGAQQRLVITIWNLKLATAMLEQTNHPAAEIVNDALESANHADADLRELVGREGSCPPRYGTAACAPRSARCCVRLPCRSACR